MYELFLVACVGLNVCDYVAVPVTYESEARCIQQAALIAGMVNGRYDIAGPLTVRYTCTSQEDRTAAADRIVIDAILPPR